MTDKTSAISHDGDKPINVRLVHRNYKQPHQIFMKLINNPPAGVVYSYAKEKKYLKKYVWVYRRFGDNFLMKRVIVMVQRLLLNTAGGSADVLHVVDQIIDVKPSTPPFVVDIGHISSLFAYRRPSPAEAKRAKDYLLNERCKAVIARSQASLKTIEGFFGDDFPKLQPKCRVVYPAVEDNQRLYGRPASAKLGKRVKLLFVGTPVWQKGMAELLKALYDLQAEKPALAQKLKLNIITADSAEVRNYQYFPDANVSLHAPVDNKTLLQQYFLKADLFACPSHSEVFGMVFLEALSCGLPIIGIRQYSTPEIIDDGQSGFLLDSDNRPLDTGIFIPRSAFEAPSFIKPEEKLVAQLKAKLTAIASGDYNLAAMGQRGYALVTGKGKFSLATRQQALKKIYEEAIN